MSPAIRARLKQLLFQNMDVFAWSPANMTGVTRDVAEHWLNTRPSVEPVVQGKRSLDS